MCPETSHQRCCKFALVQSWAAITAVSSLKLTWQAPLKIGIWTFPIHFQVRQVCLFQGGIDYPSITNSITSQRFHPPGTVFPTSGTVFQGGNPSLVDSLKPAAVRPSGLKKLKWSGPPWPRPPSRCLVMVGRHWSTLQQALEGQHKCDVCRCHMYLIYLLSYVYLPPNVLGIDIIHIYNICMYLWIYIYIHIYVYYDI